MIWRVIVFWLLVQSWHWATSGLPPPLSLLTPVGIAVCFSIQNTLLAGFSPLSQKLFSRPSFAKRRRMIATPSTPATSNQNPNAPILPTVGRTFSKSMI
jgi:hypothetical protein